MAVEVPVAEPYQPPYKGQEVVATGAPIALGQGVEEYPSADYGNVNIFKTLENLGRVVTFVTEHQNCKQILSN